MSTRSVKKTLSVPARLDRTHPVHPVFDNLSTQDLFTNPAFQENSSGSLPIRIQLQEVADNITKTSNLEASILLLRNSLGVGLLIVPHVVKYEGLLLSTIGIVIITAICVHCLSMLADCQTHLGDVVKKNLSYAETAEATFECCFGKRLNYYSAFARKTVKVLQFIVKFGMATIHIIIISTTFKEAMLDKGFQTFNIRWYMLILLIVILPIGLVKSKKYLVPLSSIGSVLLLLGIIGTLLIIFQDHPDTSSTHYIKTLSNLPLFIAAILCCVHASGTTLEIKNSMEKPNNFHKFPGVMSISTSICTICFMVVGFLGYLKYGDTTKSIITLSLPHNGLSGAINIFISISVLYIFSQPITEAIEIFWNDIKHLLSTPYNYSYLIFKEILIICSVLVGIFEPNVIRLVPLVGALGVSTLGIGIPALLNTVFYWEIDLGKGSWKLYKNILLIVISILVTIFGTVQSLINIIEDEL